MVGSLIIFTREQKPSCRITDFTRPEPSQMVACATHLYPRQSPSIHFEEKLAKAVGSFYKCQYRSIISSPIWETDLKIASIGSQTSKLLRVHQLDVGSVVSMEWILSSEAWRTTT